MPSISDKEPRAEVMLSYPEGLTNSSSLASAHRKTLLTHDYMQKEIFMTTVQHGEIQYISIGKRKETLTHRYRITNFLIPNRLGTFKLYISEKKKDVIFH